MKKITPTKLTQKLARYSAITAAIVSVSEASGQIIYTDVDPDFTGLETGPSLFDLDLDGDAVIDFKIENELIGGGAQTNNILKLKPQNDTNAAVIGAPLAASASYAYPLALDDNTNIESGNAWAGRLNDNGGNIQQLLRYGYYNAGGNYCGPSANFCDVTDKFIGLRFTIGTDTHYGWVRLTTTTTAGMPWTIKDYAYNATPDEAILSGQETLSTDDFALSNNIKIITGDRNIEISNLTSVSSYRLYDITGKLISNGMMTDANYTINTKNFNTGVYILQVSDTKSNVVIRKKVVIK